ncbi:MAG: ATP-binding protein [Rickettsiaceae bacterium]
MLFSLNQLMRKILPTSLSIRFILIIIIPVLTAQIFAIHMFYQKHWYNVSKNTSYLLVTEIAELLNFLGDGDIDKQQGEYLNLQYSVIKKPLPKPDKVYPEELEIFRKAIQKELKQEIVISAHDEKHVTLYIMFERGVLRIMLPYKALLNPTTNIFVLWVIFLTIILLTISLIFSKNQIRSIIELTNTLETYGRGEKSIKYKPSGAKEIRQAGLAFLKMKERIERQNAKRTQLLAMISHDLKTPLTRMKLQIELMQNSEEKEELSYDVDSMKHMIDSYLDFACGEGGEEFKTIELNQWIEEHIKLKWSKYNISITITKQQIYSLIKPHSFERAISNIIDNAFKYASKVHIFLCVTETDVIISIEDDGKGIKAEDRLLVFQPFYRGDSARGLSSSSGVGLGLAITKEIISGHYGTITLADSPKLKGLLVKIQMPIATK